MSFAAETIDRIRRLLGADWPAAIYRDRVRPQRTRAFTLGLEPREHRTEILYTLLGIELKAGNKRISCPDLGTARYLQVFARIGCEACAVPYDITKVSPVADALETGWQTSRLLLEETVAGRTAAVRGRFRSALAAELRREIAEIGAGSLMPEFRQSTRQR
jgi:hypothetical protein